MSPWTALLESLHSSLIDELIERHPEPKPELGMPIRQREFALPDPAIAAPLICEITFALEGGANAQGFALLALDSEATRKLILDNSQLWEALIKRAGREFMMREIKPRLGNARMLKGAELPPGFQAPSRVIWIPFRLNPGVCYLGVGT